MRSEASDFSTFLKPLFNYLPNALFLLEKDTIIKCNENALKLFELPLGQIVGSSIKDLTLEKTKMIQIIENFYQQEQHLMTTTMTFAKRDGDLFIGQISLIRSQHLIILSIENITQHTENIEQLTLFYKVLEKNTEGIFLSNLDNQIIWINAAFAFLTGFESTDIIGKDPEVLMNLKQEDVLEIQKQIEMNGEFKGELWITRKDGKAILLLTDIFTINDDHDQLSYIAGVCKDITKTKKREQKIYQLAYKDSLTGLYNRAYFMHQIELEIKKAKRYNEKLAVLYFDLDSFKSINDTLGHKVGDQVLQLFANELKASLREIDIIARLGGDEFVCLLPRLKDKSDVYIVTERLNKKFKTPVLIDGNEFYLSCSIGISLFPDDTNHSEELMHNADIAMYKAKKEREKKVVRFEIGMKNALDEQFKLSNHLRKAIQKNELLLHYQPIVDIQTGVIVSAEALLRWNHSMYGYVPPSKFIPIAEANGLILEIGQWVLEEACKQNKKWQDLGYKKIPIAVNISVKQLEDENFPKQVKEILDSTGLSPNYLELEITESISMSNIDKIRGVLQHLKDLQIKISIDDFGTGYSSLGQLQKLAINKIKIDRSFILDLDKNGNTELVTAIIAMAKSLDLNIIAEGIETNEQLTVLQQRKCGLGQGFLFSKPVNKETFQEVLRTNN